MMNDGSIRQQPSNTAAFHSGQPYNAVEAQKLYLVPRDWVADGGPAQPSEPGSGQGKAALTLGIIGLCIHWLVFMPTPLNIFFFIPTMIIGVVAILIGWNCAGGLVAIWGKGDPSKSNRWGFIGILLGLMVVMMSTVWLILSLFVIWGYNLG